mmetsp:Transcript_42794/g.100301  ORF Transcript_42794/g.100301 Transcript_42794/m.100301 type:complete len:282 (-) Transcript_42794:301-1146(-)
MSATKLLFIGNLPDEFGTPELRQVVEARLIQQLKATEAEVQRSIRDCEVLRGEDNRSRGFGFVEFTSAKAAQDAKEVLTHMPHVRGLELKVRWALGRAMLFVSDFSPSVTQDVLHEAFKQWGDVVSCRIVHADLEEGGASLGYGFVEYVQRDIAIKVQQLLSDNLFILGNAPRPVRVEFACVSRADVDPIVREEPPPHFAQQGTLEFDFALKWRELHIAHAAEEEKLHTLHEQERVLLYEEQMQLYLHERDKLRGIEGVLRDAPMAHEQLQKVLDDRNAGS